MLKFYRFAKTLNFYVTKSMFKSLLSFQMKKNCQTLTSFLKFKKPYF